VGNYQIDPVLGATVSALALAGIFWFLSNWRKLLDVLLATIYAMVGCVF